MMQDNNTCHTLCRTDVPPEDAKFINDRIREDYALNWLIDGLPAAEMKRDLKTDDIFFDMGFNLGNDEGEFAETPALHNHYDIVLRSVRRKWPVVESLNVYFPSDTTPRVPACTASLESLSGPQGRRLMLNPSDVGLTS